MKCAMCGRALILPTVAIPTLAGPMAYGPKCAKRAGLLRTKEHAPRKKPALPVRDRRAVDWVNEGRA